MTYEKKNWQNAPSTATPIDASALNDIDDVLVEVTSRELQTVAPMNGIQGSGKIAKFSHSCMFDLEFRAPLSIGEATDIFQFPVGLRPYIDFMVPAINSATYDYVGAVFYDASRNVLTFRSPTQDEVFCRISCFYVTTDT